MAILPRSQSSLSAGDTQVLSGRSIFPISLSTSPVSSFCAIIEAELPIKGYNFHVFIRFSTIRITPQIEPQNIIMCFCEKRNVLSSHKLVKLITFAFGNTFRDPKQIGHKLILHSQKGGNKYIILYILIFVWLFFIYCIYSCCCFLK